MSCASGSSLDLQRFREVPIPSGESCPDPVKLEQWVKAQPEELQPALQALARRIQQDYVSFPAFVQQLDATVERVKENLAGRAFGILAIGEVTKSNDWVKRLADQRFVKSAVQEVWAAAIEPRKLCGASLPGLSEEAKKVHDWVIFDDGVFSGTQVRDDILGVALPQLLRVIPEGEIQIHFAVPFMTKYAMNYFETDLFWKDLKGKSVWQKMNPGADTSRVKIRLAAPKEMDTVEDFLNSLDSATAVKVREAFDKIDRLFSMATTYFAHKVPDKLSFPNLVRPAIPEILPPYKKGAN